MSVAARGVLVAFLTATLKALGAAPSAPSPVDPPAFTNAHQRALGAFLVRLPVADLLAVAQGRATIDNALDIAEAGAAIVARAFPPVAIAAQEVRLGLEALQLLLDVAGLGASPFKVEPGYRPLPDAYSGARGHI